MTLQGFSSKNLQGLYRNLQAFGIGTPPTRILTSIVVNNDKVFLADRENLKILVYDLDGVKLDEWGVTGTSNGQFNVTVAVLGWHNNELYIIDSTGSGQNRCQVFSESGTYDRTILTNVAYFDIYDGEIFYAKIAESLGDFTIRRVDTDGTAISSFTVNDADLFAIDTNSGSILSAVSNVTYDGDFYSQGIYRHDIDGMFVDFIDANDYPVAQRILTPSIRTSVSNLYSGVGSSLRLHSLSGAYFDAETLDTSPTRTRVSPFQHYESDIDARIYYAVNYTNPATQSKVEMYEADTLAFIDEWDAT